MTSVPASPSLQMLPRGPLRLADYPCEPCLDDSYPDFSFFAPTQTVDIAKWSEDVSGAARSRQDLFCLSPVPGMGSAEAFEPKHDSASVYSMDSAYQSQTSSRRGPSMPEGYQNVPPQDSRSRLSSQFLGSDNYSPTLSSETFNPFSGHPSETTNLQLPPAAGDVETGDHAFAFTNYTTGQDYAHYTATSMPRYAPASTMGMNYAWGAAEPQPFNSFSFDAYSGSANSIDTALFQNQDPTEILFSTPASLQRHSSQSRIDTSVRPATMRSPASFSTQESLRRASTHEANLHALIMSPVSAADTQLPSVGPSEYEQQPVDTRNEEVELLSASLIGPSIDEDELLSPADAAEAQNMEEEQGKLARSHPLYNAQPDEDGKYRCPNEGQPGCNHKPTPLKCNYDKYVDSHLKPFRCNKKVCVGVQFSSTACLLRHEREAHGMHGHGSRPHLCHFADCERSVPGNGFPRRYNLFDHMKRVHDYTGPTTEPSPPAPVPRKTAGRKRKSTTEEAGEKRHKVTKLSAQQQLQQRRSHLQASFVSKKQNIIDILSRLTGPTDLSNDIQLTKEVVGLHEISAEYKKMLGG